MSTQTVDKSKNKDSANAALVSTQWVADNVNNPNIRIVEVSVETSLYATEHLPGQSTSVGQRNFKIRFGATSSARKILKRFSAAPESRQQRTSFFTAIIITGSPLMPSGFSTTTDTTTLV